VRVDAVSVQRRGVRVADDMVVALHRKIVVRVCCESLTSLLLQPLMWWRIWPLRCVAMCRSRRCLTDVRVCLLLCLLQDMSSAQVACVVHRGPAVHGGCCDRV
jgi:hypothetical protein